MEQMTLEQKELLLQIVNTMIRNFNNDMIDSWRPENFRISDECNALLRKLEAEYQQKYGDLPAWEYIDDVVACRDNLRKELNKL